jgi:hypothetical protein
MYSIICIIIIAIIVIYRIILSLNNALLYLPTKTEGSRVNTDENEYFGVMEAKYNIKIRDGMVESTDGCRIHYIYLRKEGSPKIFLFAHGNAGNIQNSAESPIVQFLLNYGSVIMFDYRGYGYSTGNPSEGGLKDDTLTIFLFVTNTLKYKRDDIILYGYSLGCSCTSWLVYYLINEGMDLPYGIIMQSGFYSLKRLTSELFHPLLAYFVLNEFDNSKYLSSIRNRRGDYPILLLHSKDDELIKYQNSLELAQENDCTICEIGGTHGCPKFGNGAHESVQRTFNLSGPITEI